MSTHFFGISDRLITYSHSMGRIDFAGPGFTEPVDIALGSEGVLYVLNRSMPGQEGVRVTKCTIDEEFIMDIGRPGEGDGEFMWPASICTDGQENVYVSDEWLHRISVFDKDGEFLYHWGETGSAPGQLNRPSGLAFDPQENLYLVDSENHRVQIFDKQGNVLHQFGSFGSGEGQFNIPWGVTVDQQGDVYVADWRNDRIQKFTKEGEFLDQIGRPEDIDSRRLRPWPVERWLADGVGDLGTFNRPSGVAVDGDGDIYVTDWGNHRVQVFDSQGRLITCLTGDSTVSKWGEDKLVSNPDMVVQMRLIKSPEIWRRFWYPSAVEVDPQGRIIIADCCRHRLQIYQKEMVASLV